MGELKLTEQQHAAVFDRGGSLLVSAAAGSGKTKVLVERVFSYLTQERANVDDFLIITYTRAAAAELRARLASELAARVAETPEDRHLRRQMFRVYQADIKTVDGFCASLLREHIHLLEPVDGRCLTPDFRVLDEAEAQLLRERALERTMETFYQDIENGDEEAAQLAGTLGAGRDDRTLTALVLELHSKIQSHPYPEKWLRAAAESWRQLPSSLADSDYGRTVMEDTVRRALFWAGQLERAVAAMEDCEPVYKANAAQFLAAAAELRRYEQASQEGWDAMGRVQPVLQRAGTVKNGENDEAKAAAKAVREKYKKAKEEMTAPYLVTEREHLEDLQAAAPSMLALLRLTERFSQRYQAEKVRRNAMDFSDQEHYAVTLLCGQDDEPTDLARQVSQRYQEIMVDEYQDTNEVQDCIFRAISRAGRNLFTVGDVKQSIYRFRLADPTIFMGKYRQFADAADAEERQPRRMVLSRNFRSRGEVLEATNFVFSDIMSQEMGEMDYTDQEKLYFGAAYYTPAAGRETELHVVSVEDTPDQALDRTEAEARFTARRIRQLLDEKFPVQAGEGAMRPVRPEDIVILMRSPRSRMQTFTRALAREGIPCGSGESEDFFSAMEIAVTVSLLEIVDNPRQDVPLIGVLRSPLVGLSPNQLAAIRAVLPEGDYYDALCQDESNAAREFLTLLNELRQAAREMPADDLLWYIYDRCHVMAIFGAMEDGAMRQARLTALYDYARQLVQSGKAGLFDFISHLRQLLENGDAPTLGTAQAAEGVQIMSIHRSKGLEFPVVILADLQRSFNRQDLNRPVLVHPELGLGTDRVDRERHIRYATISKEALALRLEREAKAEEMRILYVAMTRAREKLILIDCRKGMEKKLRDLTAMTGIPVPPEAVADADSPGEWVLLSLLHTTQAAALHGMAGVRPEVLTQAPDSWSIRLWHENGEASGTAVEDTEEVGVPQDFTEPDRAALDFVYPHAAVTTVPTKITATQLKGRELDQEVAGGAGTVRRPSEPEKPRFLQEIHGLSAAERGTAIHLVMQYLPMDTAAEEQSVAAQVQALEQRRLLTPAQAEAVDKRAIAAFLRSPLADRIRGAEQVWREYRFALLMPAERYAGGAEGEEMLLQGVADCVFRKDGALTVVDFKTDRVTAEEAPARAEIYRGQLQAYSDALSRIMEMPVERRVLYFFQCGQEISL